MFSSGIADLKDKNPKDVDFNLQFLKISTSTEYLKKIISLIQDNNFDFV